MKKGVFLISLFCLVFYQQIKSQEIGDASKKNIKIGFLIGNQNYIQAQQAAQLAIDYANNRKDLKGYHFKLVAKSMEGPWGTGSKKAVNLIFNDKVWAIVGSHDSKNAHLVEQVITKMRTVFLSVWATDPTLSQAYVPWFFNEIPNDNQQANSLVNKIFIKKKNQKIGLIFNQSYDSKSALNSFLKQVNSLGYQNFQPIYFDSDQNQKLFISDINKNKVDGLVLLTSSSDTKNIINLLQENNIKLPVFKTLTSSNINSELGTVKNDLDITYMSIVNQNSAEWNNFKKQFEQQYHKKPNSQAVYAYDGLNIIIEAIKKSNFNRDKLQSTLSKTTFTGITGLIKFDKLGKRIGIISMLKEKVEN